MQRHSGLDQEVLRRRPFIGGQIEWRRAMSQRDNETGPGKYVWRKAASAWILGSRDAKNAQKLFSMYTSAPRTRVRSQNGQTLLFMTVSLAFVCCAVQARRSKWASGGRRWHDARVLG